MSSEVVLQRFSEVTMGGIYTISSLKVFLTSFGKYHYYLHFTNRKYEVKKGLMFLSKRENQEAKFNKTCISHITLQKKSKHSVNIRVGWT